MTQGHGGSSPEDAQDVLAEAARTLAMLSQSQHSAVLKNIEDVKQVQSEMRSDLRRIETQVGITNGQVGELRLWRASLTGELKGLAAGAGGTGRLLFALIAAVGTTAGVLFGLMQFVK